MLKCFTFLSKLSVIGRNQGMLRQQPKPEFLPYKVKCALKTTFLKSNRTSGKTILLQSFWWSIPSISRSCSSWALPLLFHRTLSIYLLLYTRYSTPSFKDMQTSWSVLLRLHTLELCCREGQAQKHLSTFKIMQRSLQIIGYSRTRKAVFWGYNSMSIKT